MSIPEGQPNKKGEKVLLQSEKKGGSRRLTREDSREETGEKKKKKGGTLQRGKMQLPPHEKVFRKKRVALSFEEPLGWVARGNNGPLGGGPGKREKKEGYDARGENPLDYQTMKGGGGRGGGFGGGKEALPAVETQREGGRKKRKNASRSRVKVGGCRERGGKEENGTLSLGRRKKGKRAPS